MTRARDLGDFIADGAAAELVVDTTTLVVDSTNNRVGIGTASPSAALDVTGDVSIADKIIHTGDTNTAIRFPAADTVTVETGGSERMRIDDSGRVNVAATTGNEKLNVAGALGVSGASANFSGGNERALVDFTGTLARFGHVNGASGSAKDVSILSGGGEKFRFGSSGQLGIGGATYGTSGQILTSGGSGAAPSWADAAGGGGQFDAVASGAIANGAFVTLNSDGTVSTLQGFMSDQSNITGDIDPRAIAATFDSSNNKVVVAYNDNATDKGMAVVGTVSNSAITFGTPVQFNANAINYTLALFDTNANKVVIAYQHGVGSILNAVVGTVSGTSISFGSVTTLYGNSITWLAGCFDSNVNKCAFFFRNHANQGTGLVATVSGTSITGGSGTDMLNSGSSFNINNTGANFDSSNNKCVAAFRNATDLGAGNNKGYCIVAEVASSGNSITFGQPVQVTSSQVSGAEVGFDSNVNKCLITYRDANSEVHKARVGTVSGSGASSTISYGTEVTIHSTTASNSTNNRRIAFDSNINKFVFLYTDSSTNDKRFILGTISGTNVSFGEPEIYNSTNTTHQAIVFDSNANESVIVSSTDSGGSTFGFGKVLFGDYGASFFNWAGISQAAISNSASGTITVLGGVSENQSSLTVGSTHYLKTDGTLSTTLISGREVGKALSATKLLITQGSVTP